MKLENQTDVKIFILYLLNCVGEAINYNTVHDIVVQDEFVNHFDFAIGFSELLERGQIIELGEEGNRIYALSDIGKEVLKTYENTLLNVVKDRARRSAMRLIAFNRTGNRIISKIIELPNGYSLQCGIIDNEKTIFSTEVFVTDRLYAERLKCNFDDKAEIIYKGSLSLLSGDVNFIFED